MQYIMHVCSVTGVATICFIMTDFDLLQVYGLTVHVFAPAKFDGIVMSKMEDVTYLCAQSLHELILVRDDYLCVPGSGMNRADIYAMISALFTDL
jgi:hypothetical protein